MNTNYSNNNYLKTGLLIVMLLAVVVFVDLSKKEVNHGSQADVLGGIARLSQEEDLTEKILEPIFVYALDSSELEYFRSQTVFDGEYAAYKVSGACLDFYHTSLEGKRFFLTGCSDDLETPISGLEEVLEKQEFENLKIYGEYSGFECGTYKPWCVISLTIDKVEGNQSKH